MIAAGLAVPRVARAVGRLYQVRELKPQVFLWIPEDIIEQDGDPEYPRAANAGFLVTSEGVVVVDATNSPYHAREMLYEIRSRTTAPVRYLIDTGAAGDEVLGNEVFADLQAQILSTPGIEARIGDHAQALASKIASSPPFGRRLRGIHLTPPTATFRDEDQLSLGGKIVKVTAFDPSLSAVAVQLPAAQVVFLGDLFENQYFPRLDSRDVRRWIEALREAETWNAEVYVPGHGEPGGRKEVEQFRHFLEWLVDAVQTRVAQGKSLDQVKADLLPMKDYAWHASDLAPSLVEGIYLQLGGAPPDQPKP